MQEIEPKLVEARPQAPGAIKMGLGALQMALSSPDAELTEEQRAALRQAMPGLQRWLTSTDFLSSLSMRQALTLVTDAIRGTGLDSIDELRMLSLEEALAQAGSVLASAKQAVRIYGLDLDAIADTLAVEVLAIRAIPPACTPPSRCSTPRSSKGSGAGAGGGSLVRQGCGEAFRLQHRPPFGQLNR